MLAEHIHYLIHDTIKLFKFSFYDKNISIVRTKYVTQEIFVTIISLRGVVTQIFNIIYGSVGFSGSRKGLLQEVPDRMSDTCPCTNW